MATDRELLRQLEGQASMLVAMVGLTYAPKMESAVNQQAIAVADICREARAHLGSEPKVAVKRSPPSVKPSRPVAKKKPRR